MSLPPVTNLFEYGLSSPSSPPSEYLDTLIRQRLAHLASPDMELDMPPTPPASSDPGAVLTDMGNYLTRTAVMWSNLTESLMNGPHISDATLQVHDRARRDNRLCDLSEVAAMDVQIGRLRKIKELAAQFSREAQAIWQPDSHVTTGPSSFMQQSVSPLYEAKSLSQSVSGVSESDIKNLKSRKLLPDANQSGLGPESGDGSASEGSDDDDDDDDDDEQFQRIDMEALRQRGKGTYYCPKGLRCDKGGVDKEGKLVLFDRNSSFAQHCNKHRKPWRCEVPGCPNPPKKRKFARRDGLERHKATVKHYTHS